MKTCRVCLLKNSSSLFSRPDHKVYQRFLVHFPKEAVVRVNDKIIWEGQAYILEMPKKARQHHWEVIAVRDDRL